MAKLSSKFYPLFEEVGTEFVIRSGHVLYMQGDQSSNLYLVKSGRVRMFYISENGKEITYRIIGEGQLIGEAAFLSHLQQATISAVTDTTLITCPIKSLYPHICRHSELNQIIFELLTENYTQLCNQIKRLTINDSAKRVASYLLDLTKQDQEELGIIDHTLPYTQEELAVCLNLHRTTVARVLADFAKRGLVRLQYRKIQVLDREGLRAI
ncbi:Crp/Fnr family transcriptional regulator [Kineothrix sp. MSJ-39]|uniref:Crp/Fnr family transcriptional regulator n=1 Tax=Kineothrix sp. MSJ-39 TaxID=2841533 RepID=UPI001C10EE7B|nr:Crp/Fnr family transcriptional regulator [Kineothrix sp. MSJ-39]MBU5429104.1 Crp/Fnr family transcriptional regulator [Kineothrix sp. MSJ-39]